MLNRKKRYSLTKTTPATVMFDIFIGVFFALYVTSIIYVLWQTFLRQHRINTKIRIIQ